MPEGPRLIIVGRETAAPAVVFEANSKFIAAVAVSTAVSILYDEPFTSGTPAV
jgi:hypothetical protein